MNKILHNKYVLYFIFFVGLGDLYFLAQMKKYSMVAIFILTGFITAFFSKNMIVIFTIALVITNIINNMTSGFEGFENGDEDGVATTSSTTSSSSKKSTNTADASKIPPDMADSYRELLTLQGDIKDAMTEVTVPLGKAEDIIKKLKKQMGLQNVQ